MRPAWGREAVETIPLRLMVVAVVAGLSVIPAADALQALKDRSFLDRCSIQMETIVATAQVVSLEGIGARRTVELDLRSEGDLRADVLRIGGCWMDPYMSSVVLELSSGRDIIRQAKEPFVWLASDSQGQFSTRSVLLRLCMTASEQDGQRLVVCEVVEWTS
jgi:hypothetical protein